jgi:hypothetical protein
MNTFEVPLIPSRPQAFTISLSGVYYQITVKWNKASNLWVMDMYDNQGMLVLAGLPFVPGADFLQQFEYLGFVGQMFVVTDHDPTKPPTFDNLGVTSHLYYSA